MRAARARGFQCLLMISFVWLIGSSVYGDTSEVERRRGTLESFSRSITLDAATCSTLLEMQENGRWQCRVPFKMDNKNVVPHLSTSQKNAWMDGEEVYKFDGDYTGYAISVGGLDEMSRDQAVVAVGKVIKRITTDLSSQQLELLVVKENP